MELLPKKGNFLLKEAILAFVKLNDLNFLIHPLKISIERPFPRKSIVLFCSQNCKMQFLEKASFS